MNAAGAACPDALSDERLFAVGDQVEVNYKGRGTFYLGKISCVVGDGTYDVLYDGAGTYDVEYDEYRDVHMGLGRDLIRTQAAVDNAPISKGDKVEANYKGRGKWFPGTISSVQDDDNGHTHDILYDDGEKEAGLGRDQIRAQMPEAPAAATDASDKVPLLEGDKVYANYKRRGKWLPGTINRVVGEETGVGKNLIRALVVFAEGDQVEGNYRGRGKWFQGKISRVVGDGTYDVLYDDGRTDASLGRLLVRAPVVFAEGDPVETDYRGLGRWLPGTISRVVGDGTYDVLCNHGDGFFSYDVLYNDGNSETDVSRDMIRIPVVFGVGDKVEVSEWCQGTISREAGFGAYDVLYDDGRSKTGIRKDLLRAPVVAFAEGDKVESNYKGRGDWFLGKISRVVGDGSYDILYNDGESETGISTGMIRTPAVFTEGDKVEANEWYPGAISRVVGDGLYDVLYDDGRSTTGIPKDHIRAPVVAFAEGDKVEAKKKKGNSIWYPGTISRVVGDGSYDILYNDGESETGVSADMIRAAPAPLSVGELVEANCRGWGIWLTGKIIPRSEKGLRNDMIRALAVFAEGDTVEANHKGYGLNYNKGKISRVVGDGTHDVLYDDGRSKTGLRRDWIRVPVVSAPFFAEGDVVEANTARYPAKIIRAVGDGTYDVLYDDGEVETGLESYLIREPYVPFEDRQATSGAEIALHDKVEANYQGRGMWFGGKISRVVGDGTFDVVYDDGEVETGLQKDRIRNSNAGERRLSKGDAIVMQYIDRSGLEYRDTGRGKWGTISRVLKTSFDAYDVMYDDGETVKEAAKRDMRLRADARLQGPLATYGSTMSEGDAVEAYRRGKWYPAKISRVVGDGTYDVMFNGLYDVQYDDGDKEMDLERHQIRMRAPAASAGVTTAVSHNMPLLEGDKVEANYKGRGAWHPGVISRVVGEETGIGRDLITRPFLRLWDVTTVKEHTKGVRTVSWSADSMQLASGGTDGLMCIWDVATGETMQGHNGDYVNSVSFSPDGKQLVTGSGTVCIWGLGTGSIKKLQGTTKGSTSVSWSADGTRVASNDGYNVIVWDVATEAVVATLGHDKAVNSVTWSPDSTLLAAAVGSAVRVWDVAADSVVASLKHPRDGWNDDAGVASVSWSPDGKRLASCMGKAVRVWHVATEAVVATLMVYSEVVSSVCWSSDGTRLAASEGAIVHVWDVPTGALVLALEGHPGLISTVSWSPDGTRLASGSWDKSVRVWHVATTADVDFNRVNRAGDTPMHYACDHYDAETVATLLARGADVTRQNKDGKTCFDVMPLRTRLQLLSRIAILPLEVLRAHDYALWFVAVQEKEPVGEKDAELFFVLLRTITNLVREHRDLATAKDANGRTVMGVASRPIRKALEELLYFCGRYDIPDGPPTHRSASSAVVCADDYGVSEEYRAAAVAAAGGHDDAVLQLEVFRSALSALGIQGFHHAAELSHESSDKLVPHFKHCDKNGDGTVTVAEFVEYCETVLGRSRRVAIKFMRDKAQWLRETELRKAHAFDSKYVVNVLPGPDPAAFTKGTETFVLTLSKGESFPLRDYPYGIVMPAADRTLDAIYRAERPDMGHVRVLMKEVGEALAHLHSCNIAHGDLKMLNILRVDGHQRLIDLDAACPFDSYAANKFSSGVLPPELYYTLKKPEEVAAVEAHWGQEKAKNSELWNKLRPRGTGAAKVPVHGVRTFRALDSPATTSVDDVDDGYTGAAVPVTDPKLPYEPVKATPAMDIWAFGVVLYTLCTGAPFFAVNRDDDLLGPKELADMAKLTQSAVDRKINNATIVDAKAKTLLLQLLRVDPTERPQDMETVLAHAFFTTDARDADETTKLLLQKMDEMLASQQRVEKMVESIKTDTMNLLDVSAATLGQVLKTEAVLRKAIYDASEVHVPTCFIIVPEKLTKGRKEVADDPAPAAPAPAAAPPSSSSATTTDMVTKASSWMDRVLSVTKRAGDAAAKVGDVANKVLAAREPLDKLGEYAMDLLAPAAGASTTYYFYLVDELTMTPIYPATDEEDGEYPVKITEPSAVMQKLLPLMNVALKGVMMYNGVAGIAQCLGYPLPRVSKSVMDASKDALDHLSQPNTAASFDCLAFAVEDAKSGSGGATAADKAMDAKAVRGKALRDLEAFYHKHGEKAIWDAVNLMRVDGPDGAACWTTEASYEAKKQAKGAEEQAAAATAAGAAQKTMLCARCASAPAPLSTPATRTTVVAATETDAGDSPLQCDDVAGADEDADGGSGTVPAAAGTSLRAATSPAGRRATNGSSTSTSTPASRKKQGLGQAQQQDRAYNTTTSAPRLSASTSASASASAGGFFGTIVGSVKDSVKDAVGGAVGRLVAQAEDGLGLEHGRLGDLAHATGADALAERAAGRAVSAATAKAERVAAQQLLQRSGVDVPRLLAAASAAGLEPADVEALLVAAAQSGAFQAVGEALLAGDPGTAAQLFGGPARLQVLRHVCAATGLSEQHVDATVRALLSGDLSALEALAPELAASPLARRAGSAVASRAERAAVGALRQLLSACDADALLRQGGVDGRDVERLLLAAASSDAFREVAQLLVAGRGDDAIALFDGDARQHAVQHLCTQTGLPEDIVEAILLALVHGDLSALEALAEGMAWRGLAFAEGAIVPYTGRPVSAGAEQQHVQHRHVEQLLASKDEVVARAAAHMDDVKAHVADVKAMKDDLLKQVGQKEETIRTLQQILQQKEDAVREMMQQLADQKDEMHRQAMARQEELHKLKEDNARQLALRLLFKEQCDEAKREVDKLRAAGAARA